MDTGNEIHTAIKYIDTDAGLAETCQILSTKSSFAFDTEFDRFYREYGFKLSLLQIFDGDLCFVIDPITIKNLQPLWNFFEDPAICKVVYSCSEDIQILKVNGCNPKNIYDLQIAAKLCNYPANSLADLLLKAFNVVSDKSMQKSNWRRRPLSKEQLLYAGNDVSRLLKLKDMMDEMSARRGIARMIEEENRACEKIPVTEYKVKLSMSQKRKYDHAQQKILLSLMMLRNDIAIAYNVPPANIVSDGTLETVIENKTGFMRAPFEKGFSKKLAEDEKNKERFMDIIKHIHGSYIPRPAPERKEFSPSAKPEEKTETAFDRKYAKLYDEIIKAYGVESGEFILRGFKKMVSSAFPQPNKMKSYQQEIIDEACSKLNLSFDK